MKKNKTVIRSRVRKNKGFATMFPSVLSVRAPRDYATVPAKHGAKQSASEAEHTSTLLYAKRRGQKRSVAALLRQREAKRCQAATLTASRRWLGLRPRQHKLFVMQIGGWPASVVSRAPGYAKRPQK